MINRLHRFHGHNSLRYVYQHGRVTRGQLFAIKAAHNSRRTTYRLAVVVSKKVTKSAVRRNRIRRRLYEQVRLLEKQITKPYDIVITVYSEQLAVMESTELANQVQTQLSQAGILPAVTTPVRGKIDTKGE